MRVLYIANVRIPTEKAHGIAIMRACDAFAKTGAQVQLVVPRRRTSPGDPFTQYGIDRSFHITVLPTIDLFGLIPNTMAFAVETFAFYTCVGFWLLFGSRRRLIYTRDLPPLFFSWIGYAVAYECHIISNYRRLFFFAARRAYRLIVISKALRDTFIKEGRMKTNDILVAPSGVDLSTFDIDVTQRDAREQLGLSLDAKFAVYTGNFTTMGQDKGLNDCIAALGHVHDVRLVAVGGRQEDILRYEKKAREIEVFDRVILRGYATQVQLALYQKAADVLLMPFPDTPHYRNHMSPVKMFEYMASGVPIIASDLPTIREVLNEDNAIIVPPDDPKAIANAMNRLIRDRDLAGQLAARAHSEVKAYSWAERAKRLVQILD